MFIYKGIIYALEVSGQLARLYNSMHAQSPTIHIVSYVPDKGRAQSYCGVKLRKGFWFDTALRYARQLNMGEKQPWQKDMAYTKSLRNNRLEYYPNDYLANICPICAESPDVGLELLAELP